ncbi:uracil-DNA glycosylase [Brevibacillus centrosporus]|uniref:uracil-DNA glycosylase n=1 Tax=Brevibacillus centrosporus TaxID=54910 RepID=UPI003987E5B0
MGEKNHFPKKRQVRTKGEGYSLNGDSWLHPEVEEEAFFEQKIQAILDKLLTKRDFLNVVNFYAESDAKQLNLIQYFRALFWLKPDVLMIGEATGLDGCVRTGIPFTSERIIRSGRLASKIPGARFAIEGDRSERSATVIWGAIETLPKLPAMWNVFPLHPRDENGRNRTPLDAEIEWGKPILSAVVDLFPCARIVTVGNTAKEACLRLGLATTGHLIHPRRADLFRTQFSELLSTL